MLPLWVEVDLELKAMTGYSTFPRASELEAQHQMQLSVIANVIENRSLMAAMNVNYHILEEEQTLFSLPELNPHPSECENCDLSIVWTQGLIKVPGYYIIVWTMFLRRFLIQVPGCWKAALINRWSPVENHLLSYSAYVGNESKIWGEKVKERKRKERRERRKGKQDIVCTWLTESRNS